MGKEAEFKAKKRPPDTLTHVRATHYPPLNLLVEGIYLGKCMIEVS